MKKGSEASCVRVQSRGGNMGPLVAMTVVQIGYAGMNIISKVAMESGMNPFILVVYRQLVATFVMAPFAVFRERRTWPTITRKILLQIFLCSLFGATGNQLTYFVGLNNSTATISCALANILPAVTFLLAIPFGLETLGIRTKAGLVKIIGTAICIGGAMLLSFYHGHVIGIGESKLTWSYADKMSKLEPDSSTGNQGNFFMGPFLLLLSNVSWAIWFILQAKMGEDFDAPYTSTTLMCLMSTLQCTVAAFCIDHTSSSWSLAQPIRLVASIYAGTLGSALGFGLMSWTIQKKGPLYVSVFSPLLLVIVAFLSWALLREKLYIGTAVGSVLVVIGLYAVLWGKNKEIMNMNNKDRLLGKEEVADIKIDDMEKQPTVELHLVEGVESTRAT